MFSLPRNIKLLAKEDQRIANIPNAMLNIWRSNGRDEREQQKILQIIYAPASEQANLFTTKNDLSIHNPPFITHRTICVASYINTRFANFMKIQHILERQDKATPRI